MGKTKKYDVLIVLINENHDKEFIYDYPFDEHTFDTVDDYKQLGIDYNKYDNENTQSTQRHYEDWNDYCNHLNWLVGQLQKLNNDFLICFMRNRFFIDDIELFDNFTKKEGPYEIHIKYIDDNDNKIIHKLRILK